MTTAAAAAAARTIAVVFATKGGMGDVGKFAAAAACKDSSLEVRVVAMYSGWRDGFSKEIDADVSQADVRAQLRRDFSTIAFTQVDVDDAAAAQAELERALHGAEAVVSCVGSRQPSVARWLAEGAAVVIRAMEKQGVRRLVQLSSFGIGDDFKKVTPVGVLWAFLLNVPFRHVKKDLVRMERAVTESQVDYLLVRPVGLTPGDAPIGSWKLLLSKLDGGLELSIAKADVAKYMLQEALVPTLSRRAVTIGQPPK